MQRVSVNSWMKFPFGNAGVSLFWFIFMSEVNAGPLCTSHHLLMLIEGCFLKVHIPGVDVVC